MDKTDLRWDESRHAVYCNGQVQIDGSASWSDGTKLLVFPIPGAPAQSKPSGHVIIAGFGLSGRSVADLLDQASMPYVIIEKNAATVETQEALGRKILAGNAADVEVLHRADVLHAAMFAITVPNDDAVLRAVEAARRLRSDLYIIARTTFSSTGMRAAQLGANEVIKAEQAVAMQFHERVRRKLVAASADRAR